MGKKLNKKEVEMLSSRENLLDTLIESTKGKKEACDRLIEVLEGLKGDKNA